MQKEFVSIGIPFYNAELYLEDAICSVLAQTYTNWELILIDDGSTDHSLAVAKKYEKLDKRIRVISDGYNKKLPYRLNQLIIESKYDYIARMDADDLMSNDRLEIQLKTLKENPDIDFVTTGCLTIGKNNELTGINIGNNVKMNAPMILKGLTNILHASLLARKSWYIRNLYNTKNIQAEDYELWLTAAKKNDLNYIVLEKPLYWYRVVENVTYEKLTKGYDTQINVINTHYKDVISDSAKNKIIKKFKVKKVVVKGLNKLNLLNLLLKKRSDKVTEDVVKYYNQHYPNITKQRI